MVSDIRDKEIRQLLQKYWEGQSSLEEERDLKEYFMYAQVEDDLAEQAAYFKAMVVSPEYDLGEDFDLEVLEKVGIEPKRGGSVFSLKDLHFNWRQAAAVILIVGLGGWLIWSNSDQYMDDPKPMATIDQLNDKEIKEAFNQTKQALFLISSKFNRGNTEVSKLKKFDEAREQVKSINHE